MISVIIPTHNESRALPASLARLFQQSGDFEVIVVDGGSSDDTRQLAAREPRVRLLVAPKGRAAQMNAGVAVAAGTWLLFLHADTLLPGLCLGDDTGA
ncbi:MAG: glycosyltransferase, partial [Burkholderiales bacterium]|nr:glycosyltransferase [Burkholderiales bacterium]